MIKAEHLTRHFGSLTAVSDLSLEVSAGTILALLGPNGAGKTTTVRMLAGLIAPSAGDATVMGYNVRTEARAVRANVGFMTDVPGLYEQMTPESYLDFFGKMYGMSSGERTRRFTELLDLFELSEQRRKKLAGFSKGMKQKVALIRALLHNPAVLFLDEPTSGLDPLATRTVRNQILSFKHSSRSIILCAHDLDEAERLADRVAIMRHGRIVVCDTPARLRARASGETEIRIELVGPYSQALEVTAGMPDVLSPTLSAGTDERLVILTYRTASPYQTNPQLLTALISSGAQIVTVTSETTSLEDVYISVMKAESMAEKEESAALKG